MVFGAYRVRRQLSPEGDPGAGAASATPAPVSASEQSFEKMGIDLSKLGLAPEKPAEPAPSGTAFQPHTPAGMGTPPPAAPAGPPTLGPTGPQGHPGPPGVQVQDHNIAYHNHADLVLNQVLKLNLAEVELDGRRVAVKDLTPAEEARVVAESYEDLQAHYEQQLASLKKGGQPSQLNATEQAVLQALRAGNSEQMLQLIEQNDPYVSLSRMTNEERVKADLKRQYPTFTDEDLRAEIEAMAPTAIDRRGKALLEMAKAGRQQQQLDYLAQLGGQQQQPAAPEPADTAAEIAQMRQYAASVREFSGIPVGPEHLNYLLQQTAEINPQTQSTPFIERASTPQGVLEYEFWRSYGPVLYQQQQAAIDAAYQRGRNEVVLNNFPAQPVVQTAVPTQGAANEPVDYRSLARTGLSIGGSR